MCIPLTPIKADSPTTISSLYKPTEDISLPSDEKLAAFRNLIMGAWDGKVLVDEVLSEVGSLVLIRYLID